MTLLSPTMRTALSSAFGWATARAPRVLLLAACMTAALYLTLAVVSSGTDVLDDPGFDCDQPDRAPSFLRLVWVNGLFITLFSAASGVLLWARVRKGTFAAWVPAALLGAMLVGLTVAYASGVSDIAAGTNHSRPGTLLRMVHGWVEFTAMFVVPAAVYVREKEQQTTPAYAPLLFAGLAVPLMLFGAVVESQWTFGLLC